MHNDFHHDWQRRHHRHRHKKAAQAVSLSVVFTINLGTKTMQVNLSWTTPILRADGTALALTDIKQVNLNRNGELLTNPLVVAGTNSFSDLTPLTGNDTYDVEYVTTDGLVSQPSNSASVVVTAANPAKAVSDLTATLITP
jgi:hypothetical protein